jgi:hypothetical protein
MNSNVKIPITSEIAGSLKTIPLASKDGENRSYHPSYRSLSVILDEGRLQGVVQTLPSFLLIESGPLGRAPSGSINGRAELYFRVDSFDAAATAYGEPLAD